jgi:hypothetical protein
MRLFLNSAVSLVSLAENVAQLKHRLSAPTVQVVNRAERKLAQMMRRNTPTRSFSRLDSTILIRR